ncbi:MAG: DegT/DnrJ/EryC1/StrS family aminotransferase [Ignavibacteria bacterium]
MYKIPLFDLNYDEQEEQAVIETLRSRWVSMGPKVTEFENKFKTALGSPYAIALSSCTASLHLALKALGVKEGDEIICPSLTFVATVNAIRYQGAKPVFCDIKSYDDLTIDPVQIEQAITQKTKGIIVMHYAGYACDMTEIISLANYKKLFVVEDACHGILSEYQGSKLGTIGDVGCFSFFANKNLSTGEGGMAVTDSDELYEKIKVLRSHGMTSLSYDRAKGHTTEYDVIDLGYNYRMDDIRASLGLIQLSKLRNDILKRQRVRKMYLERLEGIDSIIIPFNNRTEFSANYIFVIVLKNSMSNKRDRVRNYLAEKGIQTSIHYPAVHRFSIYRDNSTYLPLTEYVSDNVITLPMYSRLTTENVDYICENIRKAI